MKNQTAVATAALRRIGRVQTQSDGDILFVGLISPTERTK
jgi:hypothetical protein